MSLRRTDAVLIRPADYSADGAAIREVRIAVFVVEQGVPLELELDERDPDCRHWLAFDAGRAVATGRLDLAAGGKVGRVAVLASHRGRGVGAALMAHCHAAARAAGLAEVWCNAQTAAAPFYRKLGYRAEGRPFEEAGIAHVRMRFGLRGPAD